MEPFPTHSYDGGLFEARRCLLVDRALTGSLDGRTVEMEGDGTQAGGLQYVVGFHFICIASDSRFMAQENSIACQLKKVS